MKYSPIILFAFNRLDSLKATVASLQMNSESAESDLFVFVDGAREHKEGEKNKVQTVQEYVKTIVGFKSLTYTFNSVNKGLGPSVIAGVTEIVKKYGCVIVLEDDLIVQPNFLSFMNQGLIKYKDEKSIFSICGYNNKIKVPEEYKADSFVYTDCSSWSWAIWDDRWFSIDWILEPFDQYRKYSGDFNKWNGSQSWRMLVDWHEGKNQSWSIRFNFAQFLQKRPCIAPIKSFVSNIGFDGRGTNCQAWSRFNVDLENTGKKQFVWPDTLEMNPTLVKRALWYWSLPVRIYSKLMYILYSILKKPL